MNRSAAVGTTATHTVSDEAPPPSPKERTLLQASHHLTLLNGNKITVHKLIPVNGRMAGVQVIGNGMETSQVLNHYPKGMEEPDE